MGYSEDTFCLEYCQEFEKLESVFCALAPLDFVQFSLLFNLIRKNVTFTINIHDYKSPDEYFYPSAFFKKIY